jgi:hypothetical protein
LWTFDEFAWIIDTSAIFTDQTAITGDTLAGIGFALAGKWIADITGRAGDAGTRIDYALAIDTAFTN